MPNHIHVIIEIFDQGAMNQLGNMNHFGNINHLGVMNHFGRMNHLGAINRAPTGGDLAGIVRWYKGRTAFECRKENYKFSWQRNYYEHIVRNDEDYSRIVEYITNNPSKWTQP